VLGVAAELPQYCRPPVGRWGTAASNIVSTHVQDNGIKHTHLWSQRPKCRMSLAHVRRDRLPHSKLANRLP
jgi:hypothetical protein